MMIDRGIQLQLNLGMPPEKMDSQAQEEYQREVARAFLVAGALAGVGLIPAIALSFIWL